MDTEAGGPPGCSRGGGHLPEGCYDVAAGPQQGPNRLHLPFQLSNALQKAHYVQLQPSVALCSRCSARHAMFSCTFQQMSCKAC